MEPVDSPVRSASIDAVIGVEPISSRIRMRRGWAIALNMSVVAGIASRSGCMVQR